MSENFRITLIAVAVAIALLVFTDVRAGSEYTFPAEEHPEVVEIICDGLVGDNDGYEVPKLNTKE